MLSDTRGDDHVILAVLRLGVELLDNLLRLHLLAGHTFVIRKRVLGFPFLDVSEPGVARG